MLCATAPSEHSPGDGNAGVSTGEKAVLLLRVDHGGRDCQGGTGVDYRAGSVGNKKNADLNICPARKLILFLIIYRK